MGQHAPANIDYSFQPSSYFWAEDVGIQLTSSIKGARRRALHEASILGKQEMPPGLQRPALPDKDRRLWGAIDPSFMGGEYLPDRRPGEVEIARITIASTTRDVTSVYARREAGQLHHRVVDEYEGQSLTGEAIHVTDAPMTLGELVDFFLGTWDLFEVLEMNTENGLPLDEVQDFILDASSSFYADFGRAVRCRIDGWLASTRCKGSINSPTDSPKASALKPAQGRTDDAVPTALARWPHDLQRLPEDPAIRPALIGAGVPRHLWPDGVITEQMALALIHAHQRQFGEDGK